jgi:hypothetical protein
MNGADHFKGIGSVPVDADALGAQINPVAIHGLHLALLEEAPNPRRYVRRRDWALPALDNGRPV